MEYDADHFGPMVITKAGYDPRGAVTFRENANEIFGEDLSGSSFLSTHPTAPGRIEALKEALLQAEKSE
jgi:predicted Zn-dependent protease